MGTTKYTYANGLLATEDGPWANDTVAWDYNTARKRSALRLQQTASHWWTNSYAWDTSHRLVDWYPTSTERFVYDGMLLVQERNTSAPTVSYTRGVDLSGSLDGAGGIGGLLARSHGFSTGSGTWSTHSAYHADGNGNVTGLYSTSTGSQVGWYRYDAFGRLLQSSGTLASANRMRFSSKPWMAPGVDASAGLYYYGYRFYDPNTQRWVNRDPNHEAGFSASGTRTPVMRSREMLNIYGFVLNNPLSQVDGLGLAITEEECAQFRIDCMKRTAREVVGSGAVSLGKNACKTGIGAAVGSLIGKAQIKWISIAGTLYSLYDLGTRIGDGFADSKVCGALYDRCIEVASEG